MNIICQSLYYQYILDKNHFLKSPKTFRVIITLLLYNYITVAYVFDSHVFSDDPFIYLCCGHHLCEHLSNVPQLSNMLRLNKNKNLIVQ